MKEFFTGMTMEFCIEFDAGTLDVFVEMGAGQEVTGSPKYHGCKSHHVGCYGKLWQG